MDTPSAYPVEASALAWIPLRAGVSFKPLHFAADGYSLQLRVDPGTTITRHRHTGEVNAYTLSGAREIIDTGEIIAAGTFVHEPNGNNDSWRCHGEAPCIVQISLKGRVEYLDEQGGVVSHTDTHTAQAAYLNGAASTALRRIRRWRAAWSGCADDLLRLRNVRNAIRRARATARALPDLRGRAPICGVARTTLDDA